jgi:hypothetical protein
MTYQVGDVVEYKGIEYLIVDISRHDYAQWFQVIPFAHENNICWGSVELERIWF